jgi:hypothetical protein
MSKKKVAKLVVLLKEGRQMLASQKGRQIFVAVNMAPVSKFLNTPLGGSLILTPLALL